MYALKNNGYILRLIWRASPVRVVVQIALRCLNFAYGAFYTLLFLRWLVNSLSAGKSFGDMVALLLIFSAVGLADGGLNAWFQNLYKPKSDQVILAYLSGLVYEKARRADLACFEQAAFYDRYTRAAGQVNEKSLQMLDHIAELVGTVFALVLNAGFAILVDPGVLVLSVVPLVLLFLFQKKQGQAVYARDMAIAPNTRKADYVKRVVYLRDYAKELRLSHVFRLMEEQFQQAIGGLLKTHRQYGPKVAFFRFMTEFAIEILLYISLYAYIAWRYLAAGALTLGDFTSLSGAAVNLTNFASKLAEETTFLYHSGLYAQELRAFMEYEPKMKSGSRTCAFSGDIVLKDVSFGYDGRPVLQHINLTIRKGQRVAFVGRNGAGKTTLIKLLLRLYDPDEGTVTVDGADIKGYTLESYRSGFVTAFQDYQIFAATLEENVVLHPGEGAADAARSAAALRESGLEQKLAQLPNGVRSVMTREFDEEGEQFSGGEEQKVAVARVFASNAPIAVLDEPSSALDPLSERWVFDRLNQACKDKTVIFISHRLSSVKDADCIYLLDKGRIIEQGSHEELMRQAGVYADMFYKQAQRYQEEENGGEAETDTFK